MRGTRGATLRSCRRNRPWHMARSRSTLPAHLLLAGPGGLGPTPARLASSKQGIQRQVICLWRLGLRRAIRRCCRLLHCCRRRLRRCRRLLLLHLSLGLLSCLGRGLATRRLRGVGGVGGRCRDGRSCEVALVYCHALHCGLGMLGCFGGRGACASTVWLRTAPRACLPGGGARWSAGGGARGAGGALPPVWRRSRGGGGLRGRASRRGARRDGSG